MEVRDPIHGSIPILDQERPIIKGAFFQRLRNIKQLGFTEYIFPGATHTRFLHSIGVMHVGSRAFDKIFAHLEERPQIKRLKETFRLACLLHDIGHAPLSHACEWAMPSLATLHIPSSYLSSNCPNRKANHEDYTIKAIADSSFVPYFSDVENSFGLERRFIIDIITGKTQDESYFTIDGINVLPLLHQLISSEMDCDRMDYLLRDSYFCGVSYGQYDLDWMLDNLKFCPVGDKAYLGLSERAILTFDNFLIGRYHMFIMVYFHYRSVCLEQLLLKYFKTSPEEYIIPGDIEKYITHDDYHLKKIMRNSDNRYAKAIINNQIPPKIFESFNCRQQSQLETLLKFLREEGIEYIHSSSSGRASNYYGTPNSTREDPLKVVRSGLGPKTPATYFNIEESTDLFDKYSEAHTVDRLHCYLDHLSSSQKNHLTKIINA